MPQREVLAIVESTSRNGQSSIDLGWQSMLPQPMQDFSPGAESDIHMDDLSFGIGHDSPLSCRT
jgi:hypothetical protein